MGILVIIVATGCAHRTTTEHTAAVPSDPAPTEGGKLYEVIVKQVVMDHISRGNATPVIVLANKGNDREVLPIWVGMSEGVSIDMALRNHVPVRPGTHDLFASVLGQFHAKLVRVVVIDLRRDTYIATMTMESHGETKEIDARPSDAIALALRFVAPIFVSEEVIHKSGWVELPQQNKKKKQSESRKGDNLL